MKLLFCAFVFGCFSQAQGESKKVSYSVLLSRSEINEFKEGLVTSGIGTSLKKNRRILLESLSGKGDQYTDEDFDEVVAELSSRSLLRISSVLRTFIALREFSEGKSDSEILVELLDKLKNHTITLKEMEKLVQILFEAAKKERERHKTEKSTTIKVEELNFTTANPEPLETEDAIIDSLMAEMEGLIQSHFSNGTEDFENITLEDQQHISLTEDLTDVSPIGDLEEGTVTEAANNFSLAKDLQQKAGTINVDMYDLQHLNYNVDKLMKRFNILFKERAYLVQGEVRPREMEYLVWSAQDQIAALKYKKPFDTDRFSTSYTFEGSQTTPEEDLAALLGFENMKRTDNVEVSTIEDQVYINIPFKVGPISVVPKFSLVQPSKLSFNLTGTATMTLDKNKATFGRGTTLDTLSLDPFSEESIKFHPSIELLGKRKLTRKIFKILNDVNIEDFLKTILGDAIEISNIIEPVH